MHRLPKPEVHSIRARGMPVSSRCLWALHFFVGLAACRQQTAPRHLEDARLALYQQQPEAALKEYRKALDALERDTSPEGLVYRARALRGAADVYAFQLRDPARAVEVYRELIAQCPEAPETLEGRVHLASLLRHHFRDLRGAVAELTAALARNPPQSAELTYDVAEMYFELQDYEQCEIEAGRLVSKFETSGYIDDALLLRAQALAMMENRKGEAARVFEELLERFPESNLVPHALFELGRLKAEGGNAERAIELWVAALKSHPDPQVVQNAIARVRARLRATTPEKVGDAVSAFDFDQQRRAPRVALPKPPKTSAEAVGGTAEEAAQEALMPTESGERHEAPAPASAPPPPPQTEMR